MSYEEKYIRVWKEKVDQFEIVNWDNLRHFHNKKDSVKKEIMLQTWSFIFLVSLGKRKNCKELYTILKIKVQQLYRHN